MLADGRDRLAAAVAGDLTLGAATVRGPAPELTEPAALRLHAFLGAMAAGVADARQMLADAARAGGWDGAATDDRTMALVAGLNAGAAALTDADAAIGPAGEWVSDVPPDRPGHPCAADVARRAGLSAAEVVVDGGAELSRVAALAAGAAMSGRPTALPTDAGRRTDSDRSDEQQERMRHRTRAWVVRLLVALAAVTREPDPPATPASCGARPGENLGAPFAAEITFEIGLSPDGVVPLTADLRALSSEVVAWPRHDDQWHRFHVHTHRPGAVIEQVYAHGTAFDLRISQVRDLPPVGAAEPGTPVETRKEK